MREPTVAEAPPISRLRSRSQFALLAALFFVPLLAAYVLYFCFPDLRPASTTNYGQLIHPARPVPAFQLVDAAGQPAPAEALLGRWGLITVGADRCDDECLARLRMTRQLRLSLGATLSRVRRVYIAPSPAALTQLVQQLGDERADLVLYADLGGAGARVADFFAASQPDPLFLTDPNGNWLMLYHCPADLQRDRADLDGIRRDLKHLLNLSSIG